MSWATTWAMCSYFIKVILASEFSEFTIQTASDVALKINHGNHQWSLDNNASSSLNPLGGWLNASDVNFDGTAKDGAIIRAAEELKPIQIKSNE